MAPKLMICTSCYEFTFGTTKTRGSFLVEVVLWLCFLLPGVIYSLWRLSTRHDACDKCGGPIIPADTTRGRALAKQYHSDGMATPRAA
ncbi:MAG TPA: hypothetical protein VHE37_12060 [Nevskiaceae bacterium]|nr:hypothetical protein [Nevskiaceae bacterium]